MRRHIENCIDSQGKLKQWENTFMQQQGTQKAHIHRSTECCRRQSEEKYGGETTNRKDGFGRNNEYSQYDTRWNKEGMQEGLPACHKADCRCVRSIHAHHAFNGMQSMSRSPHPAHSPVFPHQINQNNSRVQETFAPTQETVSSNKRRCNDDYFQHLPVKCSESCSCSRKPQPRFMDQSFRRYHNHYPLTSTPNHHSMGKPRRDQTSPYMESIVPPPISPPRLHRIGIHGIYPFPPQHLPYCRSSVQGSQHKQRLQQHKNPGVGEKKTPKGEFSL